MSGERMGDEFSVSRFPFSHFRLSALLRPKPLGTGLVTHSNGNKYNRHAAAVSTQQCHGGCMPYSTNHLQT